MEHNSLKMGGMMEELKQIIINNYEKQVKDIIENVIITKGYVKTPNNKIVKLDVFNDDFNIVNIEEILNLMDAILINFWNIPSEIKNPLIEHNLLMLLPMASTSELENYINYCDINEKILPQEDLDRDVDKLLKECKVKHKPIFEEGYQAPEHQARALINKDVVYCKKTDSYYIFDKKKKEFVKLSVKDVREIIESVFTKAHLSNADILDYMMSSYLFMVITSDLPLLYNNNLKYAQSLDDCKRDYEKVKTIMSQCG